MEAKALKTELTNSILTSLIDKDFASNEQYRPKLLVNNSKTGLKILNTLQDELLECEEFAISVAFINWGGIINLLDVFERLEKKGVKGRILTTNYLNFTQPEALSRLNKFSNIEIKMFKTGQGDEGFHTKGYIFKKNEIFDIIVGSSNLTQSAITVNKEWNIRLVARTEGEYATKVVEEFNSLWYSEYALDYDIFIDQYTTEYKVAKRQREIARENQIISLEQSKLAPNSMQVDFIESIEKLIVKGEKKALLISATGTGKTYASAFAMREINVKNYCLLYIGSKLQYKLKRVMNWFSEVSLKQVY